VVDHFFNEQDACCEIDDTMRLNYDGPL